MEKNDKKIIKSWAFFDWANSAYILVVTGTIFPTYYIAITTTEAHGDKVTFFGHTFVNTALSNYALSFSYFVMMLLLPILSSIADARGLKKLFMKFFTYMGAIACAGLFFFKLDTLDWGIICFVVASMGYVGGVLFNNSYLPIIASVDQQDRVSAKGYTYGYIGSVILQIICLVFVLKPALFGITDATLPARLSFLLVGIWWVVFAQIPFAKLPKDKPALNLKNNVLSSGFKELVSVWHKIKAMKFIKVFLVAYLFYSMGVQTIMLAAAGFGKKELNLSTGSLIATILLIQLVGIFGAWMLSYFAGKMGNVKVLIYVVIIWIVVCFSAYFISTAIQFYILAVVVGLLMGGIQSLSRSTFSKCIPENKPDTASFFSFYDVTEKLSIVIGLFSFAFIEEMTGSMRDSVIVLMSFFVIGLVFLLFLSRVEKPVVENTPSLC